MEIGLDVSRTLPDVLIFDGEVPSLEDGGSDPDSEDEVESSASTNSWWNSKRSWKWWWEHEHEHNSDSKEYESEDDYRLPNLPWSPSKHKKNPPPPHEPLPDPLPERAFGHIRPEEWLNAKSVRVDLDEDEDDSEDSDDDIVKYARWRSGGGRTKSKRNGKEGKGNGEKGKEKETSAVYAVTAKVVDVPLEVLPGRQKEFSNFVSKVIWNSEGALAGLQGTAAVGLTVEGLPLSSSPSSHHSAQATSNYLVLAGLLFQGSVRINKKSLLKGGLWKVRFLSSVVND